MYLIFTEKWVDIQTKGHLHIEGMLVICRISPEPMDAGTVAYLTTPAGTVKPQLHLVVVVAGKGERQLSIAPVGREMTSE